jgi:hypothetical protein
MARNKKDSDPGFVGKVVKGAAVSVLFGKTGFIVGNVISGSGSFGTDGGGGGGGNIELF